MNSLGVTCSRTPLNPTREYRIIIYGYELSRRIIVIYNCHKDNRYLVNQVSTIFLYIIYIIHIVWTVCGGVFRISFAGIQLYIIE